VNRTILAVAILAAIDVCGSSRALAQGTPSPPADTVTTSNDDFVDQQMLLLPKQIESIRKQLIAANLTLTDTEATKFWPVYEQYSADLRKITNAKIALIREYAEAYGSLTDEQADSLVRRWLDTDIASLELHKKYLASFRGELGGKKAATFFQVEHRINMMIDLQLTSQLPLVQSQDLLPSSFTPKGDM
jgi:hypothetical protein